MDINGQGDCYNCEIDSIDEAKDMAEKNGWSSFTVTQQGHAYFKKFDYQLSEEHLQPSGAEGIWIYNPNGHINAPYKWKTFEGHDIPDKGDVHNEKEGLIE